MVNLLCISMFGGGLMKKSINDIIESAVDTTILQILLFDRTTEKNIIWATNDYSEKGKNYEFSETIEIPLITGENEGIIKPRIEKDKESQTQRSKDKAEVFTPAWVCNVQNNLIDKGFLGVKFNTEKGRSWEYEGKPIKFPRPNGKTWQDYVSANRLEIACGEAPYLTSRYDSVTGKTIKVKSRIGLLDRKLRIISENVENYTSWLKWAKVALQSVYGFEWQGDNLLLARENVLYTVIEHYYDKYKRPLPYKTLVEYAEIISWNIWQMDGIKFVIPESCHNVTANNQMDVFGNIPEKIINCPGCDRNDKYSHNGIYCKIKDWKENKILRFIDIQKGGKTV